jgi:hypothetical protein
MSLGWQSESALLPSKATPINVDSKSMMGMKALVYKLEHNLSAKAAGREGATYDRKVSRHSSSHQDRKLSKDDFSRHSKGDAKTRTKAEKAPRDESDEISDKVAASLRAKAALYDQIISGNGSVQDNSQLQNSVATSGSGAFLINFDEKRKADDYDSYDRTSKNPKHDDDREGDRVGDKYSNSSSNSSSSSSSSSRTRAANNVRRRHFCHCYIIVITVQPFLLLVVPLLLSVSISLLLHRCHSPLFNLFLFLFLFSRFLCCLLPFCLFFSYMFLFSLFLALQNNKILSTNRIIHHITMQQYPITSAVMSYIISATLYTITSYIIYIPMML